VSIVPPVGGETDQCEITCERSTRLCDDIEGVCRYPPAVALAVDLGKFLEHAESLRDFTDLIATSLTT
jgi:hypothetical protein